ncbi:unnamed protein product [Trichobilharzia szidati]|nr:unnamed protein product [Trichobilharzia szidati]
MPMDSYNSSVLFNEISQVDLQQLVDKETGAAIHYIYSCSSSSPLPYTFSSLLSSSSLPISSLSLNQQKYYQITINSSNINQNSKILILNLNNKYSPPISQVNNNNKISLSAIHIYGKLNSVFSARQLIMNLLPVVLMFDVSITEGEWLRSLNLTDLCRSYDVSLAIRPTKSREFRKTVVIRTRERNIRSLYIMWQRIQELLLHYAKAIETSIYGSKCLNSVSYQVNSGELWPNDIFKSKNEYKEVERFPNRRRITCDDTQGYKTINHDEMNKENMMFASPTLSSHSMKATTSRKPFGNTICSNQLGGAMNSYHHHHHHHHDRDQKDRLSLMDYESSAELKLKSDSIVTDNSRIWKGCDDLRERFNIQTNEMYVFQLQCILKTSYFYFQFVSLYIYAS